MRSPRAARIRRRPVWCCARLSHAAILARSLHEPIASGQAPNLTRAITDGAWAGQAQPIALFPGALAEAQFVAFLHTGVCVDGSRPNPRRRPIA